jgi:hypothetical protein
MKPAKKSAVRRDRVVNGVFVGAGSVYLVTGSLSVTTVVTALAVVAALRGPTRKV